MNEWACLCGAYDCPSCGPAQGLRGVDETGDPLPEYDPGDDDYPEDDNINF